MLTEIQSTYTLLIPEYWDSVASIIGAAIALLALVFGIYQWHHREERRNRNAARKIIHAHEKKQIRLWDQDNLFLFAGRVPHMPFYRKMTIYDFQTERRYENGLPRLNGSYLITGEAGCGKSAVLKQDFRFFSRNPFGLHRHSVCAYYFDAERLLSVLRSRNNLARSSFINQIKTAELKKLALYVDGVDEIADGMIGGFEQFCEEIRNYVPVLDLRISCRTEFANKYLRRFRFDQNVRVEPWTQTQLQELADVLLNSLRPKGSRQVEAVRDYIYSSKALWKFIDSPLLLKMLLCINLYSQHGISAAQNRFQFYSEFFRIIVGVYHSQSGTYSFDTEEDIDAVAADVFSAYIKGSKVITYRAELAPLMKQQLDQDISGVSLTHETFYEYLVARHYSRQLHGNGQIELATVLQANYPNAYADFITDALMADDHEAQHDAIRRMGQLLAYTLLPAEQLKLQTELGLDIPRNPALNSFLLQLHNEVSTVYNPFLSLKYEIIFRLGRFPPNIDRDFRIRILEFIYDHDTNTGAKQEHAYFVAVLKRCCAISSSFLGGEKIELDYTRHIVNCKHFPYDFNFDLANRSHTLVYYADVSDGSIYTFRDTLAENTWDTARSKRMQRLAEELPGSLAEMTQKQIRKYYFRVFDIATIYSFLYSRPLQILTQEELQILQQFRTDFVGMSAQRREFLELLKTETVQLVLSRKTGIST